MGQPQQLDVRIHALAHLISVVLAFASFMRWYSASAFGRPVSEQKCEGERERVAS
jgi:hypothetical protein